MILSLTAEICQPSQSCICDTSWVSNMMIIDRDKYDDNYKHDEMINKYDRGDRYDENHMYDQYDKYDDSGGRADKCYNDNQR